VTGGETTMAFQREASFRLPAPGSRCEFCILTPSHFLQLMLL